MTGPKEQRGKRLMFDKRDRPITYLCVLWWSSLKLMFSDPLQTELFKGGWSSAEKFFNQHNCHACHTRFVLLSKLTGLPILRRPTSFPAPSLLSLPRERNEGAANAWERRPSENQAKFTLTSVEIHFAVEMPQSRYSVWPFFWYHFLWYFWRTKKPASGCWVGACLKSWDT